MSALPTPTFEMPRTAATHIEVRRLAYSQRVARAVIEGAAASVGIAVATLLSDSREPHIVEARRIAARVLREEPYGWSLPRIGRALGGIHHTTVLNLLRTERRPKQIPPKNIAAASTADLLRRVAEIDTCQAGLRAAILDLDGLKDRLCRAIDLLASD